MGDAGGDADAKANHTAVQAAALAAGVARALGRLGPTAAPAVPALAQLLSHPEANLRKEAAIALGETATPTAIDPLQHATQDPDPDVRKIARLALRTLGAA